MSNPYQPEGIRFGAAYYLEYQPAPEHLERDLDLMRDAHFTVIRVGESVWSTWEPRNGVFDLDWLEPVLDGAHARGIGVILGTPTYAVPPWLAQAYPEIAGEPRSGQPMPWGSRQEIDYTHPAFLFHAERVIRRIVARYAGHPAVIGYQVDNEPGNLLLHNRGTFIAFREWLKDAYADVETLNREWGLVYWSHRLSDWSELWLPDGNVQPQYGLAWRKFQALRTAEFIGWQADIVREYARDDQFVTTCISYDRPAVDECQTSARLDIAAANPYYGMQDHLDLTAELERPDVWVRTGVDGLIELADRGFAMQQARYLVTETNAQAIHAGWQNLPPYAGQILQAGLALVARGAAMIEYWHWHTLHFGAETYWGGVLPHSQVPGRIYAEVRELGERLEALGGRLDGYVPDHDVTVLFSNTSKYAFEEHPFLANADGSPRARCYLDLIESFQSAVLHSGRQARVLHEQQFDHLDVADLVRAHPVMVAAGFYTATTAQLEKLRDYALAGGHLIVGPRTGYGDQESRARFAVAPDVLRAVAGVHYEEFANLPAPLPVTSTAIELPDAARATRWADGVLVDNAEVLVGYEHPHHGRFAAVTTTPAGSGRVTYVGTLPDRVLGAALFTAVLPAPVAGDWSRSPHVTVFSGTADGGRVFFLHNWGPAPAEATLPCALTDAFTGGNHPSGHRLDLPAWSVAVLFENRSAARPD
ncbi:MAG TPA: beta-galactosidase [Propionicimonas sp.]|uniref:beta-galactosidase n=1 Tax=Propionicimonas sp. TaxID=1955623 RepID=UPI002F3ED94A